LRFVIAGHDDCGWPALVGCHCHAKRLRFKPKRRVAMRDCRSAIGVSQGA
jgi:hypothetical protein